MNNILKKITNWFKKPVKEPEDPTLGELLKKFEKTTNTDLKNECERINSEREKIDNAIAKLKQDKEYYIDKKATSCKFLDAQIKELDKTISRYTELKVKAESKEKERQKSDSKKMLESYNSLKLKKMVENYGFNFSVSSIFGYIAIVVGVPTGIAYISKLKLIYVLIIASLSVLILPVAIFAYYKQQYNIRRFEMVIDYLTNILPIFMQKAKISYALNEIKELVNYQMRDTVDDALLYLMENMDDSNAEKTALEMIEMEFPNSRIKSVHNLMLTVEQKNSVNFKDICQNMYTDIDNWIRRVNDFQKELKSKRTQLLILCGVTLLMNLIFVFMYTGNEYFEGFTDNQAYQIATMIFIILIVIVAAVVMLKLNGEWLINDLTASDERLIRKQYEIWENGKQSIKKAEMFIGLISIACGAYFYSVPSYMLAIALFALGIISLTNQSRKYNSAYSALVKHFSIQFPTWLREITLNLYTQTIINSIEDSMISCSYPMYRQLELFVQEASENPTSIAPYSKLLHDFDIKEAQSSIKVLFSVNLYGQKEIKDQITSLVDRNQAMLDKAESLKNKDNLMFTDMLGYVPMIIFAISMMINMMLLFSHMMGMLSNAMAEGMNISI